MQLSNPIRAIDLFCGIGGNSCGARAAGVEIVAGFDMWELAGQVYVDNFSPATFYHNRLQDINIGKIKNQLGKVDLILASPECTSHSVARGNKEKSIESLNLAYQVLRFAMELNPRWVVIENVTAMQSWNGYQEFLKKLRQHFHVSVQKLNSHDFGVPQKRRRLFLICDRDLEPGKVSPPSGIFLRTAEDILDRNGVYRYSSLFAEKRAKPTIERAQRAIEQLGSQAEFLLVYYGSDKSGGWQRIQDPLRTITTLDRFALVRPGPEGHEMRMLQPPELQAAMGFPESFAINRGTRRDKVHLLGNAVCPPVVTEIVRSLSGLSRPLEQQRAFSILQTPD